LAARYGGNWEWSREQNQPSHTSYGRVQPGWAEERLNEGGYPKEDRIGSSPRLKVPSDHECSISTRHCPPFKLSRGCSQACRYLCHTEEIKISTCGTFPLPPLVDEIDPTEAGQQDNASRV